MAEILVNARDNLIKCEIRHLTASNVRLELHHYNIVIIIVKKGGKSPFFACLNIQNMVQYLGKKIRRIDYEICM